MKGHVEKKRTALVEIENCFMKKGINLVKKGANMRLERDWKVEEGTQLKWKGILAKEKGKMWKKAKYPMEGAIYVEKRARL